MGKAIIKGAHISAIVNSWSRHATPKKVVHVLLSGVSARKFYNHIDTGAAGMYVPYLHARPPANFMKPGSVPLSSYGGVTPSPLPLQAVGAFAALHRIEFFMLGHFSKWINGWTRDGKEFVGLAWTGTDGDDFIAALDPAAIVWKTGDDWGAVSDNYKTPAGGPIVDADDANDVPELPRPV